MHEMTGAPPRAQGWTHALRRAAITVLASAAVGAALPAHAQGHHAGGMGGPHRGAGMMMFDGPPQQIGREIDRMLDGLGVTDAQRSQIKQIATAAAADLKTQHEAARGLHEKGRQIFAAPTVDAAAAEALRQQMLALHDQASKRALQAMLDVAKVLTPEQRAKIGERMKEREAVMKDRRQRMLQQRAPHAPQAPAQK